MLRHQARPKSQPPIKLSEVVTFNKRQQEQTMQRQANETTSKTRAEEEQHWSKMIEKYERARSSRFNGSKSGLKTLCEHQPIGETNDELELDESDISPLTSSGSSSSGSSSLASSTLSLSSVSSASTVMAAEAKRQSAASNHHKSARHPSGDQLEAFKPNESAKDSLGSDEESSSSSSSCSSSSGISSIGRTTKELSEADPTNQLVARHDQNIEALDGSGELERAVAQSLEALVSSVAASQDEEGQVQLSAPIAFDVLMVKEVPIGENLSDLSHEKSSRDIINRSRRCIFNALTHAQKVGRREAGWRVELQLADSEAANCARHIRWFKEHFADGHEEVEETAVLATQIIDCLVEHELVIWLIGRAGEETVDPGRLTGGKSSWVAECSSSAKRLINSKRADEPNKLALVGLDAMQFNRQPPNQSQVCGNLIGITADCDRDQARHSQQIDSVIWLCSNELEAEQVQEAWIKFGKWRADYSTARALADEGDKTRVVAINSAADTCENAIGANLPRSSAVIYDRVSGRDNLPAASAIEVARDLLGDEDGQDQELECSSSDDPDRLEQTVGDESEGVPGQMEPDAEFERTEPSHRQVETSTGGEKTDSAVVKVAERAVKSVSRLTTLHTIETAAVVECNNELGGRAPRRRAAEVDDDRQTTTTMPDTTSNRPALRKTISVFNLTTIGDRSRDDSLNRAGRHRELSLDNTEQAPGRVGGDGQPIRCGSSKMVVGASTGEQHRARPASNQMADQRTLLRVSSTCDLSSSGQRQQQLAARSPRQVVGARPASPVVKLAGAKQTSNGHPQQRADAASVSAAPIVKPRTSILKRQVAGGGKEAKARPTSQLAGGSGNKAATRSGIAHDDGDDETGEHVGGNKCDLQRNIDGTDCSSGPVRQTHGQNKRRSVENGSGAANRLAKGESIDQLNEPFKCSSQSSSGSAASGRRGAAGSLDSCAQVVVVPSPAASAAVRMPTATTLARVATSDEHLAPREITPIARDSNNNNGNVKSKESLAIKLDNQPRRLLVGTGKINSPNCRQQRQSSEVCDESQLNRQPLVRQTLVKAQATNGNANGSKQQQQQHSQQSTAVNQSKTATTARRKAVHSLANCELLARHHHNQQLLSTTATKANEATKGNSVTIRVSASREQKSEVAEDNKKRRQSTAETLNGQDDHDDGRNELEFVASGSVAREQAFERLRQRASCYDITRLMSKNSIIQNQLARLRATGPSRGDSLSASSNDLRQRKPAELLLAAPAASAAKGSADEAAPSQSAIIKRDSTVVSRRTANQTEPLPAETEHEAGKAKSDESNARSVRGKVPVGGVAVLRHQELGAEAEQKRTAIVEPDEEEESELTDVEQDANEEDQSASSDEPEASTETEATKKEPEERKPAPASGLSKLNLLRQSFNQKTISSMLKFSSRASLRIKTSKPTEKTPETAARETNAEAGERQAAVAPKQVAVAKTSSKLEQQQQQQIAALDSASLMLYNRHLQQRQQRELLQQQQQHQYALQWQQHQIYIQQQHHQQQQRQQLAFMANHYVTTHHHQMLAPTGVPLALGGYSSAASSMYAAQQLMMMQQQHQPIQQPAARPSNVVGNILRKSILKLPKSATGSKQTDMQPGRMVYGAQHYAHAPSQQQHGHMVPLEVNHHSSVNIVYGAESTAPNYNHSGSCGEPNEVSVDRQSLVAVKPKQSGSSGHNLSASSLKASMRKTVRSILVNRTASDEQKKVEESKLKQQQSQQVQKPLKSALKSSIKRTESTLNLNSDGSDGDHSNSSTLETSSSSSDRFEEPPVKLKSALKKTSSSSQNETKLVPILLNSDDSCTSSNSSDTSFKRAISARCSRRLTIKASAKSQEPPAARVLAKPMKKNVTFSTKLTSIQ